MQIYKSCNTFVFIQKIVPCRLRNVLKRWNRIRQKVGYFLRKIQTLGANNSRLLRIQNAKFLGYYFYMNTNIWRVFKIYISVPLISQFFVRLFVLIRITLKKFRNIYQRYAIKKMFLEISQNSPKSTCTRVSFLIKLQASSLQLYSKRDSGTGVFLTFVNFTKLLRTLSSQNTFGGSF